MLLNKQEAIRHDEKVLPDLCYYTLPLRAGSGSKWHYDDHLDDPEDELRFPPEIFDVIDD